MTISTLIVLTILVVLLVYVAQQLTHPWPMLLYIIAGLLLLIAIIKVLGVDLALTP